MPNPNTVLNRHRTELRSHFTSWLLEEEPGEVLDLGAGSGELVAALVERGVKASGVESRGPALQAAIDFGHPVTELELEDADGAPLPAGAAWITIRHVLHHLRDPSALLARAVSAAGCGLLVAEPTSATGLPMHRLTVELEGLLRALDRKSGMVHGPDLSMGEVAAALPPSWRTEVRIFAPMTPLPPDEVEALIERSARGSTLDAHGQRLREEILRGAAEGLVAPSGSAVLMAKKPLSSEP